MKVFNKNQFTEELIGDLKKCQYSLQILGEIHGKNTPIENWDEDSRKILHNSFDFINDVDRKYFPNWYGKIIFAKRTDYRFGIYIGHCKVIHYSTADSEITEKACVQETDIVDFSNGDNVICLEDNEILPFTYNTLTQDNLFSPKETVKRATTRLGEHNDNLWKNNNEYFATWCKTGSVFSISDIMECYEKIIPSDTDEGQLLISAFNLL